MLSAREQTSIAEMNLDERLLRDYYDELFRIQKTPEYFYLFGYKQLKRKHEEFAKKIIWC